MILMMNIAPLIAILLYLAATVARGFANNQRCVSFPIR